MTLTAAAVDLAVDLGPLRLANPVVTAAGTFGTGREAAPTWTRRASARWW